MSLMYILIFEKNLIDIVSCPTICLILSVKFFLQTKWKRKPLSRTLHNCCQVAQYQITEAKVWPRDL